MGLLAMLWRVLVLVFRAAVAVPLDCLAWLRRMLGIGGPPLPPRYVPETSASDVLEGYKDMFTRELATDHAAVSDLGHAVHRYAAAEDPWVRSAVDLVGLDDRQTEWLLGLRDDDLRRLASAGPRACELAARGERSGLVGLPMPSERRQPAEPSDVYVTDRARILAL